MSETYFDKLKDPRWQKKRLLVLHRDKFTCSSCGSTDKELHVHHMMYESKIPWETRDFFLITLCTDCHKERHELEKFTKHILSSVHSNEKYEQLNALLFDGSMQDIEELIETADVVSRFLSKKHNWNLFGEND